MSPDPYPHFDKVIDLLLDMVCVVDVEGRYVFVSAACEHLLGYTQTELIGTNMLDLVHPDDRERTVAAAANVMDGQSHTHFENRYVHKDGRIVHIMWSARWLESDRVRLAVARDVTDLKHAAGIQSAIYRISEAAHAAEGLLDLYEQIHHVIGDLLPADNFFVALYDDSNDTLSFPYFVDERRQVPEPHPPAAGTPLAEVIDKGKALLTTSTGTDVTTDTESAARANSLDWLGVPLISHKGVIGALVVRTCSSLVRYTKEDKDLLQFISTQVATAIERKQVETRLRHMAGHDALTDLPNRTLFNDQCDTALKRAHRHGDHLALMFLDLDEFKNVNDTLGHEFGDRLLREVARRLSRCVRESDLVGRMGGDEFTVLLTDIHEPDFVNSIVGKIRAAVSAPMEFEGRTMEVSVSIGVAVYPEHGHDREQLFRHADASMYAAKKRAS